MTAQRLPTDMGNWQREAQAGIDFDTPVATRLFRNGDDFVPARVGF